jgi:hypothetical protein
MVPVSGVLILIFAFGGVVNGLSVGNMGMLKEP